MVKIQIDYTNIDIKPSEKVLIKRQAELLFSKLEGLIQSVNIQINDANGPKGGVDKQCTVMINEKQSSSIIIKDSQSTTLHATRNALHRANHAFLRQRKRKQLFRRNARPDLPEPLSGH